MKKTVTGKAGAEYSAERVQRKAECLGGNQGIIMKTEDKREISQEEIRRTEDYLKGYGMNRKLLRMDRYEKTYFCGDESDMEAFGEAPLARARMYEIRHFVMKLDNSDEKLFLYYRYIKEQSVERCGELLGLSRSSAFRMRVRALTLAAEKLRCEADEKREK